MIDRQLVVSPDLFQMARRRALSSLGTLTLSAGAIALLGARDSLAAAKSKSSASQTQDAGILNTALGAELEAIAAYQRCASSRKG